MRTSPPTLLPIFRSRLQADLLALVFLSGEAHTVSDLAQKVQASRSSVQRELARLLSAGILEREEKGRTSSYFPADSPVRAPLRELIEATVGVVPRLSERIGSLAGVDAAVIYGSWASGRPSAGSDVDLLVIGTVDYADLVREVATAEHAIGREIDVKLFTAEEFESRVANGSGFLRTALSGPTITLTGELPKVPE